MSFAPIGLSVYSRLDHLKETVLALAENDLAEKSELYIFSDAPREGDERKVTQVREYLRSIRGFRRVEIIERKENSRIRNNRDGLAFLLDSFHKVIWLEEDIVTAPGFLTFMNSALDYYSDSEEVISVSGYSPPIFIPEDYHRQFICSGRANVWGVGFWKDKFDLIQMKYSQKDAEAMLNNKELFRKLKNCGEDLPAMARREISGEIDALDIKLMTQQALNGWISITPVKSLVQNIGTDGSGVNCGVSDKFYIENLWNKKKDFCFSSDLSVDQKIAKSLYDFRKRSFKRKVKQALKTLRLN